MWIITSSTIQASLALSLPPFEYPLLWHMSMYPLQQTSVAALETYV